MKCPFLEETEVRFCEVAPFRKMLPLSSNLPDHGICASPEHRTCPWAQGRLAGTPDTAACPFLRRALVQYCSGAPERRFIPYSERLLTCCGTDSHHYCDLYLSLAKPKVGEAPPPAASPRSGPAARARTTRELEGGVEVPPHLAFSANHMWLDLRPDATWHLGVDALFARAIGSVEEVRQIAPRERARPAALVRAHGVNLLLSFPKFLPTLRFNVGLRADPSRVISDPYDRGWLFEGAIPFDPRGDLRRMLTAGMILGEQALGWMKNELDRMTRYVHDHLPHLRANEGLQVADGGVFSRGFASELSAGDLLQLHEEFFSADREGGKS